MKPEDLAVYVTFFEEWSKEEFVQCIHDLIGKNVELQKRIDYLYKHARENVRDIDPNRNEDIRSWVEFGASDHRIATDLVDDITPKIVEKIRLEMGIKKPKGRPKKS